MVVASVVASGCGGGGQPREAPPRTIAVLTSHATDVLKPARRATAERVDSDVRAVAADCRLGRRVTPSLGDRAGRAVAELSVWLGQQEAVSLVRSAVERLRRRYPTCAALRALDR